MDKLELGKNAVDMISGFEGKLMRKFESYRGKTEWYLEALSVNNKPAEGDWFDEGRVKLK